MSETNGIKWVDELPPKRASNPEFYNKCVPSLRQNTGKWALLRTFKYPAGAYQAARSQSLKFPDIEFTVRGNDLYARHVTNSSAEEEAR